MTDDLTNQILLFDVCSLYRIECAYKIRVSYLAHMNLKRQTVKLENRLSFTELMTFVLMDITVCLVHIYFLYTS